MRIIIRAEVERADGTHETVEVCHLARAPDSGPSSGLGLFLAETRAMLSNLQSILLREQVSEYLAANCRCQACSAPLAVKDTKKIVYRTAFGKAMLPSPRMYSRCSACGFEGHQQDSFSPLAVALPERTHPQWLWLQTRYASVMSYDLARTFLAPGCFAGAAKLPLSSVRASTLRIGARLEAEMQNRIAAFAGDRTVRPWKTLSALLGVHQTGTVHSDRMADLPVNLDLARG